MLEEQMKTELEKLGLHDIVHPLFYNCPVGLRFEIGVGEVYDRDGKPRKKYIDDAVNRAIKLFDDGLPQPDLMMWDIVPNDKFDEQRILDEQRIRSA